MNLKELKKLADALDDIGKQQLIYFLQSRSKAMTAPIRLIDEIQEQNMGRNNDNQPNLELKKFDRLIGTWSVNGQIVAGTVNFKWLEGGFFLVQEVDMDYEGRKIKGVEYIGYDESNKICSSHFFDNVGHVFTYDWEIDGNDITIWFGRKGSNNRFKGKFSEDGNSYNGTWEWPGGGYEATLTRVN